MRQIESCVEKDLRKKMVFIGGPRQCGKTTLAKSILARLGGQYYNWDVDEDRTALLQKKWVNKNKLIVFDELHKYGRWKNWIKGLYDSQKEEHSFLVAGSARLDVYRRGGDSLLGRYHYWRLHPFTLGELPKVKGKSFQSREAFDRLIRVGGFPEPFLDGNETEARRWRRDRFDRILRDDIRDLEPLRDIQTLSLFVETLRKRVGSTIVLSNIANELQVAPKTLKHWLQVLERMYLIFIVWPYSANLSRAILKPPKVYFYDNADVNGDEGARYENLVATHLLKRIQFLEDRDGYRYELRYLRDKEKREVDFVVVKEGAVDELVEAKWADENLSKSLAYYSEILKPNRSLQIVANLKREYSVGKLHVVDAVECLKHY